MNQEVKAQWVEALRSGEYIQAVGWLRSGEEGGPKCMCALGVLVDVVDGWADQEAQHEASVLVPAVLEKAGLPEDQPGGPELAVYGMRRTGVWELNDELGLSFDQIADLIEEQL